MSTLVSKVARGKIVTREKMANNSRNTVTDNALLIAVVALSLFGVVMIASASMALAAENYGNPFYFASRQLFFLGLGLVGATILYQFPLSDWEKYGPILIITSLLCLVLVLLIGKEVNGSKRWIDLGLFTVQVSETVKLFIIVYLAGYLVRRGELVQNTIGGFLRPLALILVASVLLLLEPDFGAVRIAPSDWPVFLIHLTIHSPAVFNLPSLLLPLVMVP